ncbi:MAG: isoprenylcysteine carboxylmethyltransferase family protein [Gammaproteobacteria bacterium]|nr:isoprenylcysteine carboxylmethyltransferase family protein [Gammaproteobacteria bacterium]
MHSHVLVGLQIFFVAMSCYPVGWRNAGSAWFLILCLIGTILGIVVLYFNRIPNFGVYPEVKVGAELITGGPYRYVRHPMYSALVLMMVGIAGYNGHWLNGVGAVGIAIVVVRKALLEEHLLSAVFPQYRAYKAHTTRFVPYII